MTYLRLSLVALALAAPAAARAQPGGVETAQGINTARARVPAPECEAYVGYDRDQKMPGYILPTVAGKDTCIPFSSARFHPPEGYEGDYYVDEFTDRKLRDHWLDCGERSGCDGRVMAQVRKRKPPNGEYRLIDAKARSLRGKLPLGAERGSDTDLALIRRPGFFARAPYHEPIAALDAMTYIVEFTVPVEPYERIHLGMSGNHQVRGWYIRGRGVPDGKGGRTRALIIHSGGGGDRVTAIDDPIDAPYYIDPTSGKVIPLDDWPNDRTGVQGQRTWREAWRQMHEAGFDVLVYDRRGVGVSGGFSDTNTLQQGEDLVKVTADLRTGSGMRVLTPEGQLLTGRAAAAALAGGAPDKGQPTFFSGSSRGTMASSWAMTINFDRNCRYDLKDMPCTPATADPTIKGAMLFAEFSSGAGYIPAQTSPKNDARGPGRDRGIFIGGTELENNLVFFPSSAILAGTSRWPSVFLARGLWDYANALEGSMDSYARVDGPKELVVVRAPHPFAVWPEGERMRAVDRAVAYATAVVQGRERVEGARPWSDMKELVATSSDLWEPSTRPHLAE